MKKKPWYIWLSIIAYFGLSTIINWKRLEKYGFWADLEGDGYMAGQLFSVVCVIFAPQIPFLIVYFNLHSRYPVVAAIVLCAQVVLLYFSGVYATYRLARWKERNMPSD